MFLKEEEAFKKGITILDHNKIAWLKLLQVESRTELSSFENKFWFLSCTAFKCRHKKLKNDGPGLNRGLRAYIQTGQTDSTLLKCSALH